MDEFAGTKFDGENQDGLKDDQKNGIDEWDPDPKDFLNNIEGKK